MDVKRGGDRKAAQISELETSDSKLYRKGNQIGETSKEYRLSKKRKRRRNGGPAALRARAPRTRVVARRVGHYHI